MRLPRSSSQPLFRSVLISFLIALGSMLPLGARAAAQQLSFSPKFLSFGSVIVGQTETQVVVVTNAGSTSLNISAIGSSSSEFTVSNPNLPVDLGAGQSLALSVTFAPTGVGWTGEEGIIFSDGSDPMARLVVAGNGVKRELLTATPLSLSFGQVPVGTVATRSVVLQNDNSGSVTVKAFWPQSRGFLVKHPALPVTLTSGASITVSITFAPQAAGFDGSSIFISGPNVDIPVTGTGTSGTTTGQLTIAPNALSFGSVDVGATAKESVSMSATGGSVTVSSASSTNSQFAIPGSSLPLTIGAGQTLTLDVVFSPTQTGTASAKLTFASNASNASTPVTESLSGVGIQPQYSVVLSWSPSSSAVAGYNVYRGLTSGSYSRLNSTLNANTSYTDNTVASGTTYYYAATAVSSSGQESGYSTPLKVVVP